LTTHCRDDHPEDQKAEPNGASYRDPENCERLRGRRNLICFEADDKGHGYQEDGFCDEFHGRFLPIGLVDFDLADRF